LTKFKVPPRARASIKDNERLETVEAVLNSIVIDDNDHDGDGDDDDDVLSQYQIWQITSYLEQLKELNKLRESINNNSVTNVSNKGTDQQVPLLAVEANGLMTHMSLTTLMSATL